LGFLAIHTALLADFDPLKAVVAAPLFTFSIGSWEITFTNVMFMISVSTVFLMIWVPLAARPRGMVPAGAQNLIESVCVFLREEVARPLLSEHTDRYIPFIWTVFFFILSLNLFSMIPTEKIITLFTGKENHFGGPATANIWVTGAMAVVTFFTTHISGIRRHGFLHYFASLAPPVPWAILPLIYFLEIISTLVKPFALAIRLFANMFGGHTVLATILGLILLFRNIGVAAGSVVFAVLLSLLELLVALVQAYIFTMLTALYIGFSLEPEH
jgi:F-type H+-transporting ATPase subunit a